MGVTSVIKFENAPFEIIDGDRGKNYPKQHEFLNKGHCLFLSAKNVTNDGFIFTECQFISKEKDNSLRKGKMQPDDVVLTTRGTVGNVAYYSSRIPFDNIRINSGMVILRPEKSSVLPSYLYYFLKSTLFHQQVNSFISGVAQPQLPISDMKHMKIFIPPLKVQDKIAAILSAYDDLIENNLRRIKILEEMAQNLYREWFVNFRFPGHENTHFVDSPLGKIPEGWEIKQLGEMADQMRKSIDPVSLDSETPYIGLEHIPRKSITQTSWGFANEVQSTKLEFRKEDIIFGKIRPYFHKVVFAPITGICSSDAIVMRAKAPDYFGLVLGCTSSSEFIEHATATSQGTKMPRANWDVLSKYQIPVPTHSILCQYNGLINNITHRLSNFVFQNINLRQTRDLLLPKLISGEVDVSELDIKVPEEVAI